MRFFKVKNLGELKKIVKRSKEKIYFLAGCTDFMVYYKDGMIEEDATFIDISEIKELKGIKEYKDRIEIGSLTTFSEIIEDKIIKKYAPVLVEASKTIGSKQIRNRATIGGNIANSSPAGDSIPALYVLGSFLKLIKGERRRKVKIEEFFIGVKKNILENGEIIERIIIPKKKINFYSFKKIGPRNALSISKVSCAISGYIKDRVVKDISISFGSVGPTVIRCREAEEFLIGKRVSPSIISKAKEKALKVISPITDFRSSGMYRFHTAGVLFERILKEAI